MTSFRDELRQMFPDDELAKDLTTRVRHIAEFLHETDYRPRQMEGRALLHLHCHHRSILNPHTEEELLRATGMDVQLLDTGCCGMAGDYGFRKETYDVAMKLAELRFLPHIRERGDAVVVTDGYSCREQTRQCLGYTPLSFPELLVRGLLNAGSAGTGCGLAAGGTRKNTGWKPALHKGGFVVSGSADQGDLNWPLQHFRNEARPCRFDLP